MRLSTNFRSVFFDLDGTLVDQFEAIRLGCAAVAEHLGKPEPTLARTSTSLAGCQRPESLAVVALPACARIPRARATRRSCLPR